MPGGHAGRSLPRRLSSASVVGRMLAVSASWAGTTDHPRLRVTVISTWQTHETSDTSDTSASLMPGWRGMRGETEFRQREYQRELRRSGRRDFGIGLIVAILVALLVGL